MPYIERITRAGKTIEVERYFTSRYKKQGIKRGDKVKPTTEQQQKINTRQAERKLRILINANYGYGDYHLVLDYIRKKGEPPRTKEQMRQDMDIFLRECRKEYKKAGLEFKYIHVMEIGDKGARHHHLVINQIDTKILQQCWYKAYEGHNRVKVFPLDDSGNYADLAAYLIKYTDKHRKREEFGHWEMDSVIGQRGKSKNTLLVLTERKTRDEIIFKLPDKTAEAVVDALDALERKWGGMFKQVFKSITVDNGSEFAYCEELERSILGEGKRTQLYYCHPYSSWERGTNEVTNKMVRRKVPKGTNFDGMTDAEVEAMESWINNYPRRIHGYHSAGELFEEELKKIG